MAKDRFRREYRELSDGEKALINQIKNSASELDDLILSIVTKTSSSNVTERDRAMSLARTNLEQSVMWAVKGITG